MYLTDFHTHSACSPDGTAPVSEMAQAAIRAGIREMCITDHVDMLDGAGQVTEDYDWAPLTAQYTEAQQALPDGFSLRLGIELGGAQEFPARAARLYARPGLDFVIGSIHNRPRDVLGGEDLFYGRYISPEVCYKALDGYFACLALLAACHDGYDVLGHIIYPLRYMNDRDRQNVTLKRYYPQIEAILKTAAQGGKGMEINTWRGRTIAAWQSILSMFRRVGGEFVTLGSDAHMPKDVGKGIAEAMEMMRQTGLRYYATYERHQPILHML